MYESMLLNAARRQRFVVEENAMPSPRHTYDVYRRSRREARALAADHARHQHECPPNTTPQHRVYLIDCRSCGAFLTDRGMKAVLLLRPHITLFSTDAIPNCGQVFAPSRTADTVDQPNGPKVQRTCDCLTQVLACYGCGTTVGYHIVSPCSKCTESVSKHQRNANGHRTVLHCNEITARPRRYVPGEPGVRARPVERPMPHIPGRRHTSYSADSSEESEDVDEYDDDDDEDDEFDEIGKDTFDDIQQQRWRQQHLDRQAHLDHERYGAVPTARVLTRGDPLYWSDLVEGGERFEPIDSDECLEMPVAGR